MSDKIIDDLYSIRDHLDQVQSYINKIKNNLIMDSFVQTRQHLYDIYNDRLDLSNYTKNYFDGHKEVVTRMKNSDLQNVRLSVIDGDKRSCSIFSSEDFSTILGVIFYDN
ncbi:hypothetical protein AAEU33_19845 [Chryseobacterium sp. Chry.R1]|uniref:hypothetical protein n=1 Tax=Chryseobacterium sp. Chry.R1 TaxID=3139392 RepID=UPI0031F91F55